MHEMMHAFFQFWGDETLNTEPVSAGRIGIGGHGRVWADAMVLVEGAWNRLYEVGMVPFKVNCAVFDSVCISMYQDGWRATAEDMRRWGAPENMVARWGPGGEWGEAGVVPESMRTYFSWVVW